MHTYPHICYAKALRFPLATAMLLGRHRKDVEAGGTGPDNPIVRAMTAAANRVRAHYEAHYTITPNTPT